MQKTITKEFCQTERNECRRNKYDRCTQHMRQPEIVNGNAIFFKHFFMVVLGHNKNMHLSRFQTT